MINIEKPKKSGSQLRHSTSTVYVEGRTKPIVSANYVVGLTDGEGCFYVNVAKSQKYAGGARIDLCFYIKMQERDRRLLEKVRKTLGCGAVYFQKENRPNHTQCYRYTVASHRDIIGKIIPFFKKHNLQSDSKRTNFKLFCQIADFVKSGNHLTKKGVQKIRVLKQRMNQRTIGLA